MKRVWTDYFYNRTPVRDVIFEETNLKKTEK
jgi:hypothetical protein